MFHSGNRLGPGAERKALKGRVSRSGLGLSLPSEEKVKRWKEDKNKVAEAYLCGTAPVQNTLLELHISRGGKKPARRRRGDRRKGT